MAVIQVEDSGIGIAAADQEPLFERFFRASTATEHAIAGTGLGLSIAQALIYGHGGLIEFTSKPGETRFTVRLPTV